MLRFGRSNSTDKLIVNELSEIDGSEAKSVHDLEMGTGTETEGEHSITRGESAVSDGLLDILETSINEKFANNPSFMAEYNVAIGRSPIRLEESSLFQPLFRPQMIAVGPHHNGLSATTQLENHKLSALQAVCGDNTIRERLFGVDKVVPLRDILTLIGELEAEARRCYERYVVLPREKFVQVLLIDSVFIIVMIILELRGGVGVFQEEWVWETEHLFKDLILMENQIPFFILEKMWNAIKENIAIKDEDKGLDVIGLFKRTYFCIQFGRKDLSLISSEEEGPINNLLALYYRTYVPIKDREPTRQIREDSKSWFGCCAGPPKEQLEQEEAKLPSAIDLYEAGLHFRAKKDDSDDWDDSDEESDDLDDSDWTNMFDITFENGVLQIPTLEIDSGNMSLITNLLCHENENSQYYNDSQYYSKRIVASYVYLMDSLIDTKADIALLQKFGIVNNKLASDDQAAAFINSLGEHCREGKDSNFYDPVIKDVRDFIKPKWRRNYTSLRHNYCTSPWTSISLIAGIFLLFLACVQTYYAVFPRK